jgi:hypothetical protein
MNLNPQELIVFGTLAGAFIGGLFTFLSAWVSKRSDERKYYRELMIKVASEQWIHQTKATIENGGGSVAPYDIFLIHLLQLARLLEQRKLSSESVIDALKRADTITQAAVKYKKGYSEAQNNT